MKNNDELRYKDNGEDNVSPYGNKNEGKENELEILNKKLADLNDWLTNRSLESTKKKYEDQKLDTKKLKDELEEIKIKNKEFKENTEEQEKKANFF